MIGIVVLKIDGEIQAMSTLAKELLHAYFPSRTATVEELPDQLRRWVNRKIRTIERAQATDSSVLSHSYQVNHGTQQLMIRLSPHPELDQFLLLLEEVRNREFSVDSLLLLGLTKREAEVLFLVSKDKTPVEIGQILLMSDRTVKKHLEHIYRKFGVKTRLSAIIYVLEKLAIIPST
jgi:DNA-binding CsgD family transcriptional regulator